MTPRADFFSAPSAAPRVRAEDRPLALRDWGALAMPGLIWGSSFYLIAEGLDSFEPFVVTWMRIMFGLLVVASVPSTRQRVPRTSWPSLLLLGVVWLAVPLSLFPLAEQRVSSSLTGMLNGATPLFAAFVAALIVRRLPPQRQIAGLVIGLVGIVLIAAPSWSDDSEGGSSAAGVLMVLAALACYGVAINLAGPLQRQLGALPVVGRALAVAFVLVAPLGIAGISGSDFTWGSALAVAALGAFGTGLAYVLMASNSGRYGGTRAASTTYLIPAVSVALGITLRGESVEWVALVGCAVALAGAYLVNTAVRGVPGRDQPAGATVGTGTDAGAGAATPAGSIGTKRASE
jgi:drug/metabolite transporter (DMT)-like permease